MADRIRRASFPRVTRSRRHTAWFQFAPVLTTLTASGGTIIFSLNAAALALRPFTVVRSRFSAYLISDQATLSEQQNVGLGHAVVSDEAVSVGVTAVPTPLAQLGSDLWFQINLLFGAVGIADGTGSQVMKGQFFDLDSRAMRKVAVGQDIVSVAEGLLGFGSGCQIFWGGRMLVKLH